MNEHEERTLGDHGHRHEVLRRIVGQRLEGMRVGDERRRGGAEEVVAVGRRARRGLPGEDVARTRAVVDDDGLPERARQVVGDEAAHDVGRGARRKRDDDPDRLRRPALRAGGAGRGEHRDRQQRSQGALHDSLLASLSSPARPRARASRPERGAPPSAAIPPGTTRPPRVLRPPPGRRRRGARGRS